MGSEPPEASQDVVLAGDERRSGHANTTNDLRLELQTISLALEQVFGRIEVLEKVELRLGSQCVEPVLYRVTKPRLRVRKYDRVPLRLFDDAERSSVGLHPFLGHRMRIEERSAGNKKTMDVAQGVHDALSFNSSQGRREQGQVEALGRGVDLGRPADYERDLVDQLRLHGGPGLLDSFSVGIDRENGRRIACVAERHAPVAAAQLENAKPRDRSKLVQSTSLDALWVDEPTHGRSMTQPRSSAAKRASRLVVSVHTSEH